MSEDHLSRLRRVCTALPDVSERLSHGEPTFFTAKRVFAMFSNNHHNDGHIAVWLPAAEGEQASLIDIDPRKYYRPPYVGVSGWVGVELAEVSDEELAAHVAEAYKIIRAKSRPRRANSK